MPHHAPITARRVYDEPGRDDGYRVLVDRVWPRGLSKDRARLDEWCKQVAPSTQLRQWYGHDPTRFDDFVRRYRIELEHAEQAQALDRLREISAQQPVTLLTATKQLDISQAAVLAQLLRAPVRGSTG
jgi:uncharacterized protein YeaO (DUF488 family)